MASAREKNKQPSAAGKKDAVVSSIVRDFFGKALRLPLDAGLLAAVCERPALVAAFLRCRMAGWGSGEKAFRPADDVHASAVRRFLETLLSAEFDVFLGRGHYVRLKKEREAGGQPAPGASGPEAVNYRNGSYLRGVRLRGGRVTISVPRDRCARFASAWLKRTWSIDVRPFQDAILAMAASLDGMEGPEGRLSDLKSGGESPAFPAEVPPLLRSRLHAWQERKLASGWPFVSLLCLRPDQAEGAEPARPVYAVLGLDERGRREVLALESHGRTECQEDWIAVLRRLARRGVRDIELACTAGSEAVTAALRKVFPRALHHAPADGVL